MEIPCIEDRKCNCGRLQHRSSLGLMLTSFFERVMLLGKQTDAVSLQFEGVIVSCLFFSFLKRWPWTISLCHWMGTDLSFQSRLGLSPPRSHERLKSQVKRTVHPYRSIFCPCQLVEPLIFSKVWSRLKAHRLTVWPRAECSHGSWGWCYLTQGAKSENEQSQIIYNRLWSQAPFQSSVLTPDISEFAVCPARTLGNRCCFCQAQ